MENLKNGQFDYCFADIWIGNNDTVHYMKLKKMKMPYWIEDSLKETIIGFICIIILQEFYKNNNIKSHELMEIPEDEEFKL